MKHLLHVISFFLLVLSIFIISTGAEAQTVLSPGANLTTAMQNASAGQQFLLNPGVYTGGLTLINRNGTPSNPIVVKRNGNSGTVEIQGVIGSESNPWSGKKGLDMDDCTYMVFENITFSNGNEGVHLFGSDHIIFLNCQVINTGNAGVKFSHKKNVSTDFTHHIDWIGGRVTETGQLQGGSYGEGIYIGQSQQALDATHDIWLENIEIDHTNGGEAIDIKEEAYNITIRNCNIHDIEIYNRPGDHSNRGAIQVLGGVHKTKADVIKRTVHSETWIENVTINRVEDLANNTEPGADAIFLHNRPGAYVKNCDLLLIEGAGLKAFNSSSHTPNNFQFRIDNYTVNNVTNLAGGTDTVFNNANQVITNEVGINPMSPQTWYSGGGSTCGTPINWANTSIGNQAGTFTAEWDMTPDSSPMEGAVGLSNGTASAWGDLATIVRFNTGGNIDVRNGGGYSAQTAVSYSANTIYHIRQVVDVNAHTYSVFVTPAGGSEITLATNYNFRTENQNVTQLTHRAVKTITCSLSVSNFTISGGGDPGGGSLEGIYYLKNQDSGKRMKAKNSTAGQLLELGSASGTGSNYEFTISEVNGDAGYYFIEVNGLGIRNNDCNDPSGTYVETHNGTGDCVRWEIIENGSRYNLKNKDNGLFARNDDCEDNDGNEIELTTGTGGCAQWTLEPVGGGSSARIGSSQLDPDRLNDLDDGIAIYPNPVGNSLTISGEANFNYHIVDLSGRVILRGYKNTPLMNIDVSNIGTGVYLLKYNNGSQDFTERLVINN